MRLTRKLDESNAIIRTAEKKMYKPAKCRVHSINGNLANIYLGETSSLIRGVSVQGDPNTIKTGSMVSVFWQENRPYIIAPDVNRNTVVPHTHSEVGNDGGLLESYYGKQMALPEYGNSEYTFFGGSFASNVDGAFTVNSSQHVGFFWLWNNTTDPGAYISIQPYLRKGYYQLAVNSLVSTIQGILNFSLDNVVFATDDWRAGSTTYNVNRYYQFSVPYTGIHTLKMQTDTSSGTSYAIRLCFCTISQV